MSTGAEEINARAGCTLKMKYDEWKFADKKPIKEWRCTKCPLVTQDRAHIRVEATAGFYGPNGNGFNYWCESCAGRMNPYRQTKDEEVTNEVHRMVLGDFFSQL